MYIDPLHISLAVQFKRRHKDLNTSCQCLTTNLTSRSNLSDRNLCSGPYPYPSLSPSRSSRNPQQCHTICWQNIDSSQSHSHSTHKYTLSSRIQGLKQIFSF